MKRIAGAMALLAMGLCGCISVTSPAGENKKTGQAKPAPLKLAPANGHLPPAPATGDGVGPGPAATHWTEHTSRTGFVDPTAVRPAVPTVAPQVPGNLVRSPLPSLQPVPVTPQPTQLAQLPPRPLNLPTTPAEMPSVTTPPSERAVKPIAHVEQDAPADRVATTITTPKTELVAPPPPRPMNVPPAPSVKNSQPVEPRTTAKVLGAAPLFRLVNTKRITLNFEVKDVGASGLAAVELWFTQDGKDWKKHDAPPQAKAYVVEVDDEGTYGFTLLARSGTGLAKEPPQPGDAPQVWVIVDLTRPDVQLSEVTPSLQTGQQTVSIKWRANDRNLGRAPIALSYAEKEAGPWKVIAAGLDNVGTFNWDVPTGTPAKVLFRVEASDMAGNVGRAQLSKPVMMDNMVPTVNILNVGVSGVQ